MRKHPDKRKRYVPLRERDPLGRKPLGPKHPLQSLTPISNSPTVNTRSKTPQISIAMPTIDSPALNTRGSLRRRSIGSSPLLHGRLPVKINASGQPIGKASISLSSFFGQVMREVVPVTVPDWRKITLEMNEMNGSGKNEEPSRVDVWTKAHKENGEPVNSYVAEIFVISVYNARFSNEVIEIMLGWRGWRDMSRCK
ncbi:hypothetical protein F8388_005961 [Cannabis sativa]|uniref:Uncharacterized protein n=1 Tax=Cannabis sativa TaxID=3483 RepID=A0A7J6DXC4_CANSA|nr:hypothetical protein F8388_005961 [Cannabis sativa]